MYPIIYFEHLPSVLMVVRGLYLTAPSKLDSTAGPASINLV